MLQRLMMCTAGLFLALAVSAQDYKPVDDSSSIGFGIKNFGVTVSGTLKGLKGDIHFEPGNLGACTFAVSVASKTINSGIDMRDNHLKKEDFLNVDAFPVITFKSTKITASTKAGYMFLFGDLTIKGVTKAISFPFQAQPNGNGYTFTGDVTINRRDFGVGGSSLSMSDQVKINLKVVAQPAK
ncbi:polyisoprenoid-binding protein YceI [Dinghuibacter silviterrae]|uniref:Polyisoprenoid-binding protein YceI n=2 Tax=Dinghuibacter silviterrae TaxID=1539049 RepID=A0A4R8DVK4_9BACT|nr:polyisoprenoid-binding protein YceI [Dinghuibacter silviterrae]